MPLTKQGDKLVHSVAQGGRDEAEAGCVTVNQVRISAASFDTNIRHFLFLMIHSDLKIPSIPMCYKSKK